jgi:hypothetical protein
LSGGLRDRRTLVVLAAALFLSYAYFYQAGGWNQNSRFALIRAILERHTLQIDAYALHTGDRSVVNGHFYSDKAPGASLLGLAPAAAARAISRAVHVDPEGFSGLAWISYAATVATSGVFTVIAALLVCVLCVEWGYSRNAALFAATAYGIASPAWCYATLFMEHALVAGFLMLAFVAADRMGRGGAGVRDGRRPSSVFMIGVWTGLAVLCELQAAIPAAFIGVLALANIATRERRSPARDLAVLVAGGILIGVVFFTYNTLAFGSPLHIGYSSEEGFEQMRTGFFGISYPSLPRLGAILVGRYRGLLPLAPLMAAAPFGLLVIARAPRHTRAAIAAIAVVAYYFLLNASYYYWEGGWAYAPRHVMPALPFLALGLAPLWDASRRPGRSLLVAGWVWGAALTLIAVSTTPQPPSDVRWPTVDLLWPAFRDGDLSINTQTFVHNSLPGPLRNNPEQHASWNLGQLAGLHGHASLAPLGLAWIAAALALAL